MTIRQIPTEAEIEACLDFTPVPVKPRWDGWTPERQTAFIAALARLGTATGAAKQVAMSVEGAHALRRRPGAESFTRAWGRALNIGVHALRDLAYERAVAGTAKGVWHKGERVGEEMVKNDRLLMFMLRHEHPESYGANPPLPRGTGSRVVDVAARDSRWADDDEPEPDEEEVRKAGDARVMQAFDMYVEKVVAERTARLRGDVVEADWLLRQATLFEVLLSVNGGGALVESVWPGLFGGGPGGYPVKTNPMAKMFAACRRDAWHDAGDPPRPDPTEPNLSAHSFGGPTATARENAQRQAQRDIAAAQAMWEAAANEDSWARWKGTALVPLP